MVELVGIALLSRRLAKARRVPLLSRLPGASAATIWLVAEGAGFLGATLAGSPPLVAYGIGVVLAVALALMVARDARPYVEPFCSFCGQPREAVEYLIAGPDALYICEGCIALCADLVDQERARAADPAATPPPEVSIDRDNVWDPGDAGT